MKLRKLSISNFKGISSFTITPEGTNTDVFGDNATGKTTIIDAFTWLLFDKDSTDRSVFNIKPLDSNGAVKNHGLETCVLAIVEHGGEITEYKKVYKEKWTKKKGSVSPEFDGHETVYSIDSLNVKKNQYVKAIANMCDVEIFRMVTNPLYFSQGISWQNRRKLLFEMCGGEMSETEIIQSNEDLLPLLEAKGKHSVGDFKKLCMQERAKLNKQLEEIPVRIAELSNQLEENQINVDFEQLQKESLNKELAKLQETMQQLVNGQQALNIKNQMAQKKNELQALDNENVKNKQDQAAEYKKKLTEATGEIKSCLKEAQRRKNVAENALQPLERSLENSKIKRESLVKEYHEIIAMEYSGDNICPTCKRPLPDEEIAAAVEVFNNGKALKLSTNIESGKKLKEGIAEIEAAIKDRKKDLEVAESLIAELEEKIQAVEIEPYTAVDLPDYEERKSFIQSELDNLKIELDTQQEDIESQRKPLAEKITNVKESIQEHERNIIRHEEQQRQQKRIDELEAERVKVADKIEELDSHIYLCDEFIKYRVSIIENSINQHFKLARFKLFETQINGGINEMCEVTFDGVPYPDLNNAAKINIGIDIINTLTAYYDFTAPIFVDNAESVTQLYDTSSQVIRLIVSEADKDLRVEVA